jgi:hypothetical protein
LEPVLLDRQISSEGSIGLFRPVLAVFANKNVEMRLAARGAMVGADLDNSSRLRLCRLLECTTIPHKEKPVAKRRRGPRD